MRVKERTHIMEVTYDDARWRLLEALREEAADMMRPLAQRHIASIAYGSIARGDVHQGSDVDIFIPNPPTATILETFIESAGYTPIHREIIQATPTYAAKAYIHVAEDRSYSFPLVKLRAREREFYGFAGSVTPEQLEQGQRVPGVNKRLQLIEPTEKGHTETTIQGNEGATAKRLGVGVAVVLDRVRTLRRRDRVGRTGVYLKRSLAPDETFGDTYAQLARKRPAIRRRLRT